MARRICITLWIWFPYVDSSHQSRFILYSWWADCRRSVNFLVKGTDSFKTAKTKASHWNKKRIRHNPVRIITANFPRDIFLTLSFHEVCPTYYPLLHAIPQPSFHITAIYINLQNKNSYFKTISHSEQNYWFIYFQLHYFNNVFIIIVSALNNIKP
jgi:hypothetical protein